MKAIVFGGAGFIGSHLLKRLAEDGDYDGLFSVDVVAPRFAVDGVRYVDFDVRRPLPADLCGEGPFELYNFAAVHTTPGHADWEYYWTNVHGATHVCRFADAVGAERLTFTSTMMVYGPTEGEKDEDGPLEPVNAYGRSKILAEEVHRSWQAADPGRRKLTIVRPGVIYGLAEHGNFTRLARALRQRRFVYPGRVDTVKACGYIADLVEIDNVRARAQRRRLPLQFLPSRTLHQRGHLLGVLARRRLSRAARRRPVLGARPRRLRL